MADDLITLTAADNMLISLTGKLDRAATPGDLVSTTAAAAAFRDVLKRAKFDRVWANRFAILQYRGMRRLGAILAEHIPHGGGRPPETVDGDDSFPGTEKSPEGRFPTLDELSISRDFSSECQRMAKIPEEDFESYRARGEGDDSIEITKVGLFQHANTEDFRRYQAEQANKVTTPIEDDIEGEDEESEPEPVEAEPPPASRASNPKRAKVAAALRTAADAVDRNPEEALNALRAAARLDKRLETLDGKPGDTLEDIRRAIEHNEAHAQRLDWLLQRANRANELADEVNALNKRLRERATLIKELRAKIAMLEEENAALKAAVAA